jgi:N-acetylmuramoyl-L-alanine amidase-like protein
MASSPDHPELLYVQASGYTLGRPDGPPLWIVVHDMEADETPNTAESTANYFATGAGGRDVSSHYTADSDSVVQCVRLADTAWTVGNWQGNNLGINWELAGFASQTREQWLDEFGLAMFAKMAPIVRSDADRFGIPLVRCSINDLKAFRKGVTSHNDLGVAFGGTDHTDPGPNFPWDEFLAIMNGDDVALTDDEHRMLANLDRQATAWFYDTEDVTKVNGTESQPYHIRARLLRLEEKMDRVLTLLEGAGSPDAAPIVAAIRGEGELTRAEIRDAVADLGEGGAEQVRADPDA